jgi:hypothetical protein
MNTLKNTIIVNKSELNSLIANKELIGGENFEINYTKIDYTPKDENDIMNLLSEKELSEVNIKEGFKIEMDLGYTGWIQVGKSLEIAKN